MLRTWKFYAQRFSPCDISALRLLCDVPVETSRVMNFDDQVTTDLYERRSKSGKLSVDATREVNDRLRSWLNDVMHDFQIRGCSPTVWNCNVYTAGDFFAPHRDRGAGDTIRRVLSLVIGLQSSQDDRGGRLELMGVHGGLWSRQTLSFALAPGDALAFDSGLLHRVTASTFGERRTLVSFVNKEEI
ncbi:2OG-Fe(II) oxygenase [Achromobacter spanius]|uniref:Fe2OG dioxygenase domain-containing protein n=1 Tax=Achromobacter spanius TaxID=217203 RepID=A0A2S0I7X9_9BURK|nr:hypothetical protein CLM73_14085 [Achromobacter spanius]